MEQDLPKAIQAELEAAEAIEKQLAAEAAAPDGNTESATEQQAQTSAPETAQVTDTTPQKTDGDEESWKRRFETLTGKYNAEVPRLHQQLKEQRSEMEQLRDEVEQVKAKPQTPEPPKDKLVTSNDEETFGTDLIDVMRRVTREELDVMTAKIVQLEQKLLKVAELPKQVEQVVQNQVNTQEQQFWASVKDLVPDWNEVDTDPRWIEWLNETPEYALVTYRELAQDAINAGNASKVSQLVKAWKQSAGILGEKPQSNAKQELERQVAPAKSSASTAPTAKKNWTGDEYQRAFDPRLSAEMSETEIDALQAEAELAYQEGRIQW